MIPVLKTAAEWAAMNPTLDMGVFGMETDTGKMKRGDGVTSWVWLDDFAESMSARRLHSRYRPLRGIDSTVTSVVSAGDSKAATFIPFASAAGKYRFCGTTPHPFSGNAAWALNNNNAFSEVFALQPIVIEFWSNATDLRVHGYQSGRGDYWALVGDMRVMPGWQHGNFDDGDFTWTLTQPSAVYRKWRLCVPAVFTGISVNSGATVVPTVASGPQVAVVGDSVVQGNIATANSVAAGVTGMITSGAVFGEYEQITGVDVWRCGLGGTGYVAQSGDGPTSVYGSSTRVSRLAGMPAMDVVVAFGSANDGSATAAAIVDAANLAWSAIKAAQPTAELVVVGMECMGTPNADLDAKNTALVSAAKIHPAVSHVIDLRANSFITGTGRDGAPAGNGNQDAFVSTDGLHLTHPGHRYWGEQLAPLLGQARCR